MTRTTGSSRVPSACRWARRRLPLLAGDDLPVTERRKVERHIIVCRDCDREARAASAALGVLRDTSDRLPVEVSEGSLWKGLERQIREARHAPAPTLPRRLAAWLDERWERGWRLRPLPILSAAVVLALAALAVDRWARGRIDSARAFGQLAERPIAARPSTRSALDPPPPTQAPAVDIRPLIAGTSNPPRLDFDLDHGTPMGPDALDPIEKPSY